MLPLALVAIYLVGCLASFAVGRAFERRRRFHLPRTVYVSDTFAHVESMRQIASRIERFRPPMQNNGRTLR